MNTNVVNLPNNHHRVNNDVKNRHLYNDNVYVDVMISKWTQRTSQRSRIDITVKKFIVELLFPIL